MTTNYGPVYKLFIKIDETEIKNIALKNMYDTSKNHDSDSGFDMYVPQDVIVPLKTHSFVIGMGIKCNMKSIQSDKSSKPFMIFPRSSMGSKTPLRLANSIGLVDKDYRGEIKLIVDNLSDDAYFIKAGTRLAQIVTFNGEPFRHEFVKSLDKTERGTGGLGSTGV